MPHKTRGPEEVHPELRGAIRRLVGGESSWPLFLHGPPGRGKTCAALCLLDHAGGLYATAAVLSEWVNAAQFGRLAWSDLLLDNPGAPGLPALWSALSRTPLVVLDDVGTRGGVSDAHYEAVKRLLDEREGRPLVVVSNLDLAGLLEIYDKRVCDRLAAGTVLRLDGPDRRLKR